MLNPDPVVDAIVATLLNIPGVANAMVSGEVCRITAFHYLPGAEGGLIQAVYQLPSPSMLVAWEGTLGGNFDGTTCFKHKFGIYIRAGNMAGNGLPVGYAEIWGLVCNALPNGSPVNMRYMNLYPGLDIMDNPSIEHMLDEAQQDLFKIHFTIPEIGDN